MSELPAHGLNKDIVRADMRLACAIAHGRGTGMSLLELCVLVLEEGLPSAYERERIRAAKLAAEDDTQERLERIRTETAREQSRTDFP